MSTYTVTSVKSFAGMDGHGYNAVLNRDGKAVAQVTDEGRGAAPIFRWNDREARATVAAINHKDEPTSFGGTVEEAAFWRHCLSLPRANRGEYTMARTPEIVMAELVNAFESAKRLQRLMRTKIVFIDAGRPLMYPAKAPEQQRLAAEIRSRYPNAKILNTLALADAAALALQAGI